MIILFTLFFLFGLFSTYKIHTICQKKGIPFSVFEAPIIYHLGVIFGTAITLACFIIVCLTFLP